ncbi:ABC transporter ATP-binding protein [Desulfovermiculus halophilus]|uniref:ABC transporter ATP-binding protein n=1 Tax=Desulfovermiculus halophilus TaxID=339722 RepID=UPI000486940F|nr:ABC transporter ATP-binding protein [Desulfovermiculus halophilus]
MHTALFQLDRVGFAYAQQPVLEDITLSLHSGCFYGLLGPNGSGKTTLLDLLFGHKRPTQGRITFQGQDIRHSSQRELARHIALVPQSDQINFPFTVQEVVAMGRYPHLSRFQALSAQDLDLVDRVMDQAKIRHLRSRPVTALSGGEKQRVIFARALAQDTPVLLLDEATSNLDIKYGLHLMGLTRDLVHSSGLSVVAVFQDLNLAAAFCHRLIFLRQGRLHTWGRTEDTLTSDTLAQVFEVHAEVRRDDSTGCRHVVFRADDPWAG